MLSMQGKWRKDWIVKVCDRANGELILSTGRVDEISACWDEEEPWDHWSIKFQSHWNEWKGEKFRWDEG